MGMHFGVLAAAASLEELLTELNRHVGEFALGETLQSPFDALERRSSDGFVLAAGERDGRAFILDTSYSLSDEPDVILAISERLGTVAGVCAETVSGTWSLTATHSGDLLRHVFVQHASITQGMAVGEPLPTEAEHPIEQLDGDGLFAALAFLDLDPTAWFDSGPARALRFSPTRTPAEGPLIQLRRQHMEAYAYPDTDDWTSRLTVVVRESPQPGA